MKRVLATLLVMALPAFAQEKIPSDKPTLVQLKAGGRAVAVDDDGKEGEVLLPSGTFINDLGMTKLEAIFTQKQIELVSTQAQNEALRKKVDDVAAEQRVPVVTVLAIAAGALLIGAAAGVGTALALKRNADVP